MKMRVALAAAILSVVALDGRSDEGAEKKFRKWAAERIEILAKSKDAAKRADAASYLSSMNYPEVVPALAQALSDPDRRVRSAAAGSLWSLHEIATSAKPALTKALDDPNPDVAIRAAGALSALGVADGDLAAVRARVLDAPMVEPIDRFMAASQLIGQVDSVRLLAPILAFLRETHPLSAGDPGSMAADQNIKLIASAMERLAATGERGLVAPLVAALDGAGDGGKLILETLARFKPKPTGWVDVLVRQMGSRDAKTRGAAARYAGSETSDAAVAAWVPQATLLIKDREDAVRADAIGALGDAGGLAARSVGDVIYALRGDPSTSVRRAAARALGRMGDPRQPVAAAAKKAVVDRARGPLGDAAQKDPEADVRDAAKEALSTFDKGGDTRTVAVADEDAEAKAHESLRGQGEAFEAGGLFRALSEANVANVKAYLEAGISATQPSRDGDLPIRYAFSPGACSPAERPTKASTKEIVRLLIAHGASGAQTDANGNTPLMEAASQGCDREVMKMLIASGGRVDSKNKVGMTAFEMGLFFGHDGLEELIAAGYRLPPDKIQVYSTAYASNAKALALVKKASAR